MNVPVLRYTLDNQELANLSLSRTSQALGSKDVYKRQEVYHADHIYLKS